MTLYMVYTFCQVIVPFWRDRSPTPLTYQTRYSSVDLIGLADCSHIFGFTSALGFHLYRLVSLWGLVSFACSDAFLLT